MVNLRLFRNVLQRQGRHFHFHLLRKPDLSGEKRKIVFLGTPAVAAKALDVLLEASKDKIYGYFDIVAVVTQPPALAGRNKKLTKSPVHELAEQRGLKLFTPETAKDPSFLAELEALKVDLCLTAAYGNYLPQRFLKASRFGTVNIHPSLLPKYRGAAPVQRCLENGDAETGVSLLFSVPEMDAGPLLAQVTYPLKGDEKAPKVLEDCFVTGAQVLLDVMPGIFASTWRTTSQDQAQATHAPKLTAQEGYVDFTQLTAKQIHNKCRGFAEWPGLYSFFQLPFDPQATRMKIITTSLLSPSLLQKVDQKGPVGSIQALTKEGLLVVKCKEDSFLGIAEVQPANKKAMPVKAFLNGFKGNFDMTFVPNMDQKPSSESESESEGGEAGVAPQQ